VSDERARLFVALELPAAVREALGSWQATAVGPRPGLRLLAPESLHVTLCFLGWCAVGEIPAIAASCEIVGGEPAAEVSVGDAVWLPSRRPPRVLAVALEDPSEAVARVQSKLSAALQAGGWYVPEKRQFYAHVTVARVAKGARVRREDLAPPPQIAFRASAVRLYRSRLVRGGAQYEPLSSVELGA
jgi:RNA 2',3'-cyclic 3'-phosphodiesterase